MATSPEACSPLFLAVDVHYLAESRARAAAVAAADRRFALIAFSGTALAEAGSVYRPGEFYLRELPPLRAVIPRSGRLVSRSWSTATRTWTPPAARTGAHVHAEFGVPVIGVAKTRFRTATHAAQVLRGRSARPLYVTAAGMPVAEAAHLVEEMAGSFRMPDALKLADRLARGLELPWPAIGLRRRRPGLTALPVSRQAGCRPGGFRRNSGEPPL